jgi:xanthine phosphoribosyltransferase
MKRFIIPNSHSTPCLTVRHSHSHNKLSSSLLAIVNLDFGAICLLCLSLGFAQGIDANQAVSSSDATQKTVQPTNEKLILSWSDIDNMSKQLSDYLKGTEWTGILAITRGGLFPAGLLSHTLDIRRIETINVHSYTPENTQGDLNLLNVPYIPNSGKNWVIVDDLVDSGKTMKAVRKIYPKAVSVTLFAKPQGLPTVDYYVRKVEQNTWIVFPWEKDTPTE